MQGEYQIVELINEQTANAKLSEHTFEVPMDGSWDIEHEIHFSVGSSEEIILFISDIDAVIRVLHKAKELAEKRSEEFYSLEVSPL